MLLVVDGPEKAGKTTLISQVTAAVRQAGYSWHIVHCRNNKPKNFDPWVYLHQVRLAARSDTLVVLDRSWASDVVYDRLLNREPAMSARRYEWHVGNAVETLGTRVMLTANPKTLAARRDGTDHPVDPKSEADEFERYGRLWGWRVEESGNVSVRELVDLLFLASNRMGYGVCPPWAGGSPYSKTVVLGEAAAKPKKVPKAAWLPFTSKSTRWMADVVSPPFNRFLYTNVKACQENPALLDVVLRADRVIALGRVAERFAEREIRWAAVEMLPHPSAVVRWPHYAGSISAYAEVFGEEAHEE